MDLEAEYNNRQRVPEHPAILARWAAASSEAVRTLRADLDLAYGPGERHRYDLFHPHAEPRDAPLVVYIHGGYWQRGDRKDYSFVVRELVANGLRVALPSYSLCPTVTVAEIAAEMRLFLSVLWQRLQRRPVVVGHSAGGHLAAVLLAADRSAVPDVPADLVRAAYAISGVFELAPLLSTSINDALRLTPETAEAASPRFRPAPPRGRTFVAAVGGAESSEFLRQSRDLAAAWSAQGVETEYVVVPNADHFTVVDELTRPGSAILTGIVKMAAERSALP
ncbi:MAG: alpha/beta hydrolase [Hyphomicrobiaceae bacterium]